MKKPACYQVAKDVYTRTWCGMELPENSIVIRDVGDRSCLSVRENIEGVVDRLFASHVMQPSRRLFLVHGRRLVEVLHRSKCFAAFRYGETKK
jgi:hypothetical protein